MFSLGGKTGSRYLGLALAALLVCAATAGAQESGGDWGVTLDSDATLRLVNDWAERDTAYVVSSAFWSRYFVPLRGDGGLELAADLSYTWSDDRPYLFDVNTLRSRGTFPAALGAGSQLQATAGRFRFTEPTGAVLNHTADGAELRLSFSRVRLTLASGYTGLQLGPNSDIRVSAADSQDLSDDDEFFGPARAFGMLTLTVPQIFQRHTARVSVVGQRDLRDEVHGTDPGEDIYHSGYYSLLLEGPVVPSLFYDVFTTVSTGVLELGDLTENTMGLLVSGRLRLFRPDMSFSRASLRLQYASGPGDTWDTFVPVVRANAGTVLGLPLQNMIVSELRYSLRPFSTSRSAAMRNLQTGIAARNFFTATEELPATAGVKLNNAGRWLGNEVVLNLAGRIFVDLGFALTGGVFIPETGSYGVFSGERRTEFYAKAEISSAL